MIRNLEKECLELSKYVDLVLQVGICCTGHWRLSCTSPSLCKRGVRALSWIPDQCILLTTYTLTLFYTYICTHNKDQVII